MSVGLCLLFEASYLAKGYDMNIFAPVSNHGFLRSFLYGFGTWFAVSQGVMCRR